ncbi:MAG: endonuclease/exonuclease/phosphatase family protein [Actinomycetaceae bacterium]|nr:endonuclease/exonuclease/phosphatase family protein [Actinomycetaceae bacterium]
MRIRLSSVITGALALAIAAPALLSVKPDILVEATKITLRSPVAQILAFRGWIAAGLALLALFFLVMGLIRKTLLNRGRIALTLAFALFVASLGHIGIMAWRGLAPNTAVEAKSAGDITVLEYNTAGGSVPMEEIATLIADSQANVVALPETSTQNGEKLVSLLASNGLDFQLFTNGRSVYDSEYSSTVLLVSTSFGTYVADDSFIDSEKTIHGVMAKPADNTGPTFVAVHPVAPSQAFLRSWRVDMFEAYSTCATYENVIMAGDFNSTADHEAALHLGVQCADAGEQAQVGGLGTWPSNLPGFFAAPIDRVLTNGQYQGVSAEIVNVGESDHRGIIVRLEPLLPKCSSGGPNSVACAKNSHNEEKKP